MERCALSYGLSQEEVNLILIAFKKGKSLNKVQNQLCSDHAHERSVLTKNDSKLLKRRVANNENAGFLLLLCNKFDKLANLENDTVVSEFYKATGYKHYAEILLCCASLLIDFHSKGECYEYMPLALKFYLKAYEFMEFYLNEENNVIIETMMDHLKLISKYRYGSFLFIACLHVFLKLSIFRPGGFFREKDDTLYPILSEICELAYAFDFDFLSIWNGGRHFLSVFYTRHAIIESFKRYRILVKYGYEDQYYLDTTDAIGDYARAIIKTDHERIFRFEDFLVKLNEVILSEQRSDIHKKYRSYQVLYLYMKSVLYVDADDSKMGEKTLRMLWDTIPDPYLIKQQFLSYFTEMYEEAQPEVQKAWNWYAHNVQIDDENVDSPRSLKHYTGCSIRRTFKAYKRPLSRSTVESFDIPPILKSYICFDFE